LDEICFREKKEITGCPMLYQLEEVEDTEMYSQQQWTRAVCPCAYKFLVLHTVAV